MISNETTNHQSPYQRRKEMEDSAQGLSALIKHRRVFSIAVFASLGGLVYGYNQGMFGQVLNMTSFKNTVHPNSISNPTSRGLLVSILELGAWIGAMINGYLADRLGRKVSVMVAAVVFIVGVIIQACADGPSFILSGRFVTGLGVGSLSMIVPLYNAELAPAEVRGALVALQQLAIIFGVMISYWIGYGTNFIGGTGNSQSNAAWLIPVCIQIVPALVLGIGIIFMPQSPRWLVDKDREEEALQVISRIRELPADHEKVTFEFMEIKAQHMFEQQTKREMFPQYFNSDGSVKSSLMLGLQEYLTLFRSPLRKRTLIAVFTMVIQQCTGINAILYFAPFIFQEIGLVGNTISLLATGVAGVVLFLATIPAVLWIDQLGRKPVMIVGAIGMAVCHYIVAGISGSYDMDFVHRTAAGWACATMIYCYLICFGISWGPCAWILISEVFPLGVRAKGVSIGASSNWLSVREFC
jgi:MFS family permease